MKLQSFKRYIFLGKIMLFTLIVFLCIIFLTRFSALHTDATSIIRADNIKNIALIAQLESNSSPLKILFSRDNSILASDYQYSLNIWKNQAIWKTIEFKSQHVIDFSLNWDNSLIATLQGGNAFEFNRSISLWNAYTGKQLETLIQVSQSRSVLCIKFSPSTNLLAYCSEHNLALYNIDDQREHKVAASTILTDVVFYPIENIIVGTGSQRIYFWNIVNGTLVHTIESPQAAATRLEFSADGKFIAGWGENNIAHIWESHSYELVTTLVHNERINDVAFSPNGQFIATASADNTVKVWNINQDTLVSTLEEHRDDVSAITYNNGGDLLVTGGRDSTIRFWSTETNTLLKSFYTSYPVVSIVFSEDDTMLAVNGYRQVLLFGIPIK